MVGKKIHGLGKQYFVVSILRLVLIFILHCNYVVSLRCHCFWLGEWQTNGNFSGLINQWILAVSIMNTWSRHILSKPSYQAFPSYVGLKGSLLWGLWCYFQAVCCLPEISGRDLFLLLENGSTIQNRICSGPQLKPNIKIISAEVGVCEVIGQFIKSDQACSPNRTDTSLIWSHWLRISGN